MDLFKLATSLVLKVIVNHVTQFLVRFVWLLAFCYFVLDIGKDVLELFRIFKCLKEEVVDLVLRKITACTSSNAVPL